MLLFAVYKLFIICVSVYTFHRSLENVQLLINCLLLNNNRKQIPRFNRVNRTQTDITATTKNHQCNDNYPEKWSK